MSASASTSPAAPKTGRRRPRLDRRTAKKAARISIATTAGFVVGRYGLDDPQAAVFAAMGTIALLGMADFGGPLGRRARSYAIAVAVAAPLVAAGTLVSEHTLLAAGSLFAVAFCVVLSGALGRNAAVGGNALILFYLVAAGIPADASFVGPRLAGLAVGGALSIAAAVALWPDRPGQDFRGRLADALADLASGAESLARGSRPGTALLQAPSVAAARPSLVAPGDRPSSPTDIDRAERYLAHAIPQIARGLDRVARLPPPSGPEALASAVHALLLDVPRTLQAAAGTLRGIGAAAESAATLLAPMRAARDTLEAQLAALLERPGNEPAFAAWSERAFLVGEVAATAALASAEAGIAAGQARPAALAGPRSPQLVLSGGSSRAAGAWRRLRSNLTFESVVFRNAVRLAAGVAVARFIAGEADLQHGFWVSFAVLGVMRTSVARTGATAAQALLGTLAGAIIAVGLLYAGDGDTDAYMAMLPFVVFAAFYVARYGFLQTQAGFTVAIMVLFSIMSPAGWELGLLRVENVAIGLAVGLAIGLAAWPRGAAAQLGRALGTAAATAGAYAAGIATRLLASQPPGAAEAGLRDAALQAAGRAEDVFAAYRSEAPPAGPASAWGDALSASERLWYSADVLSGMPPAPAGPCAGLTAGLAAQAAELAARAGRVEAALKAGGVPSVRRPGGPEPDPGPCLARIAASGRAADRRAAVRLFAVRAWLGELAATEGRLEAGIRTAAGHSRLRAGAPGPC